MASHADFPTITGYRVDDIAAGRRHRDRTTLTGFDPTLDPVRGLVVARGRSTWALERDEAGGWRVDAGATQNQPLYPPSDGAGAIAREWVDARATCEDTDALERRLIGTTALALCEEDQGGTVDLGPVEPLVDSAAAAR